MKISQFLLNLKYPIIFTLIFLVLGIFYIKTTKPVFETTSKVTLKRSLLENPEQPLPELRNRWVWLRDGLTIKSAITSDGFILNIINSHPDLKKMFHLPDNLSDFSKSHNKIFKILKKQIQVDYSGPDDNFYIIKVKNHSQKISLKINESFLSKFNFYIENKNNKTYNEVISKVLTQISSTKDPEEKRYLNNVLNKLRISSITSSISSKNTFEVLQHPRHQIKRTWPRNNIILIAFSIIGLTFGFFISCVFQKFKSAPDLKESPVSKI